MVVNNFDLIVVGGGNAGLIAAITSAKRGLRVALLESAPEPLRGGNSKYTRDVLFVHDEALYTSGVYTSNQFLSDLKRVSGENTDLKMAELVIEHSRNIPAIMKENGIIFKRGIKGTLGLSDTNLFFLGGGKALVNQYYRIAEKLGVQVIYGAEVTDIVVRENRAKAVTVKINNVVKEIETGNLILASGGFEANVDTLIKIWGKKASNFIIRGSRFNTGSPLFSMIKNGARTIGDPKSAHMIPVDARSQKFDTGIVSRVDVVPVGIALNNYGKRFYDEGEDIWPKRYAIWGHLIAEQPEQIAYGIADSRIIEDFLPSLVTPFTADTLKDLFTLIGLPIRESTKTVFEYNNAVMQCELDLNSLDDCHTEGVSPPKTHWARKIEKAPFYAWPLRPGLTFTYMGLKVNNEAQVLSDDGIFENIYAAGEIMSGNILTKGYLGGLGLAIGTVFGTIAGGNVTNYD